MDRPVTAVIAEYNPFHNGHKHQIEQIKKTGSAVVVIMSGAFVQRGSAAVCSKQARARLAVENGADLVLELPVCYALSSARSFADGAVKSLDATGVINYLCFGSESGDIEKLRSCAEAMVSEPPEVSAKIQSLISTGMTFAKAREAAYSDIIDTSVMREPNNILAVEYICSVMRLGSKIVPVTIPRVGTEHNDNFSVGGFASASYIRERIRDREAVSAFLPYNYERLLPLYDFSLLDTAVIAKLRMMQPSDLRGIFGIGEGIENKILSAARTCSSFSELCGAVKSKRYTLSRIRRCVICAFLGISSELANSDPSYIRVLASNRIGFDILSEMKHRSSLPVITKAADFDRDNPMFKLDILASDIAALCCTDEHLRRAGTDFLDYPVIIDK